MKSLALAAICKNEEKHIERWLNTFLPVVDHIYLTDTGSTDQTVAIAKVVGKNKITIRHFDWIDDFAAARNFSCQNIKEDYILWADLDDSLKNPEGLLEWRKSMMETADLWLANYNYALLPNGESACTFARERVFRNCDKFFWTCFLHEGIDSKDPKVQMQFTNSWSIDHLRSPEDLAQDKGRNIGIFEKHLAKGANLTPRMVYYYGKELFEAGQIDKALQELLKANTFPDLALHDRILAIQYAVYILLQKNEYMQAINMAQSGLLLVPQRAEFFVLIGDAFVKQNRFKDALPFYEAAKACEPMPDKGFAGFIFQNKSAYTDYPRNQIVRIYSQLGDYKKALSAAEETYALFKTDESKALVEATRNVFESSQKYKNAKDCDDIVFTCPGGLYEWDSLVHKNRGIGGSETACVEMATWMKKLTGKRVIVFNTRETPFKDADGVEYIPFDGLHVYFAEWKPKLHVAWRHSFKCTDAKTVIWSHDLFVPGAEKTELYDKFLCLSEFHKNFVHTLTQIPHEKMFVTRNGIDVSKFKYVDPDLKNPNKIVYASSPDRGLERVIDIIEIARVTKPDLELHVFYGLENMVKMGKEEEAKRFKELMDKPWIYYHGNVEQKKLLEHYKDAAIWLYPTNFLETFCITALEMVFNGVYPVVRKYGALPYTLKDLPAKVIDRDAETLEDKMHWAKELIHTIDQKLWHNVNQSTHSYSLAHHAWEQVCQEWIKEFIHDGSQSVRCNG